MQRHLFYAFIRIFKALSIALVEKMQLVNLSENFARSSNPIQMSVAEFSGLYWDFRHWLDQYTGS